MNYIGDSRPVRFDVAYKSVYARKKSRPKPVCIAEKGSDQLSLPTSVKKQFHIAYKSKDVLSARALTSFTTYSTEEIRLGISTERPITTPQKQSSEWRENILEVYNIILYSF